MTDLQSWINQRLTWFERWRFQGTLEAILRGLDPEKVLPVDLLVGQFNGRERVLFLLTTSSLHWSHPRWSEAFRLPGERLQILNADGRHSVKVHLRADPTKRDAVDNITITAVDVTRAERFMSLANLLITGMYWDKPDDYFKELRAITRKADALSRIPQMRERDPELAKLAFLDPSAEIRERATQRIMGVDANRMKALMRKMIDTIEDTTLPSNDIVIKVAFPTNGGRVPQLSRASNRSGLR